MDRSSLILSFAILALYVANVKIGEITYFYPLHIILLNILGLSAAIAFFLAYSQRGKGIKLPLKGNGMVIIASVLFFFVISFQLVGVAVLITIVALLLSEYPSRKLRGYRLYISSFLIIILAFALVYAMLYPLRGLNWKGIDEIAYNYYASYLLLHGTNPYTVSMLPILSAHNITPTYLLNGSVETAYDYPAFSFLPVLFMGLFDLRNFIGFVGIVAFITIAVAFIIYRKANYSRMALLPVAVWLLVTYIFLGTIDQYIAVAFFLLIAYTERRNIMLSGIFMGLAASTIQLSWFALPFFFVLVLREKGKEAMLKSIMVTILIFLLANSYFIIAAPKQFLMNILGLFGTSKLLLEGTNIAQVFVRSYGVALWYPAVLSLLAFAVFLALFYLYTYTLKPMLAVAPAFIFMLSWHNFLLYSLPFVPLLILLCYETRKENVKDIARNRSYIPIALGILVLVAVALAIYAHSVYARDNTISINGASVSLGYSGNTYGFNGININVTNNGDSLENITFFMVTEQNGRDAVFQSVYLNGTAPHSTKVYSLPYNVQSLSGSTRIFILAFSSDYIRSAEYALDPQSGSITKIT
ncbi:MAG: hypothetical protein KGI06_02410 [Candidatus Micrarchaeota archaeon]|nr:hypothetical protein [Candidatus Micrarchaeota archaeon]